MKAATSAIENNEGNVELFVGFIQLFSSKMAKRLNSTAVVVYSTHTLFLNVYARRKQRLIDNVHKIVDTNQYVVLEDSQKKRILERMETCRCMELHHQ